MSKHVLKLSSIVKFFKEEERLIARGENAVESNHIKQMVFDNQLFVIRGEVHASMRDRDYKVEIYLTSDFDIQDATCTCPRGQVICHHIAAMCIFAHHNVSVTDKECAWIAKKSKQRDTNNINFYYPKKIYSAVETDSVLTTEDIKQFKNKLSIFGGAVGFTWLLSEEPAKVVFNIVVDIETLLFSDEYLNSSDKHVLFKNKLSVSPDIIDNVAKVTVGQTENENWLIVRKHRLTASNFGIVLAAVRRKRFPPSLFNHLTGFYDLSKIKAIQWGRVHEKDGIEVFENTFQKTVKKTGIWLHECGYLGASPDGFVDDNATIEIKCPYKYREQSLFQGLKDDKGYIVNVDNEENMIINENHDYYHQIQGQLFLSNRMLCYLVLWTPAEAYIVEVHRNEEWYKNLEILKYFYLNQYLLHVCGEK